MHSLMIISFSVRLSLQNEDAQTVKHCIIGNGMLFVERGICLANFRCQLFVGEYGGPRARQLRGLV
jgi:hypothetical protein